MSPHHIRDARQKDIFATLLGPPLKSKRKRHKNKRGSVSEADRKFGSLRQSKTSSKHNQSAENILQRLEGQSAGVVPPADPASETVEVSFEIKKKYDVKEFNYFCIENEKRSIRRAKSNDSLLAMHRIVVRQPKLSTAGSRDQAQALASKLTKSQDTLDDYASSSGDATTSEDGRTESCSSSVLESDL